MIGSSILKKMRYKPPLKEKGPITSSGLTLGETLSMLKKQSHMQKPPGQINSVDYFRSIDECSDKIQDLYKNTIQLPKEKEEVKRSNSKRKSTVDMSSEEELGKSGQFVNMQSESFEIILNILIGIRRTLGNIQEELGVSELNSWQYQKKMAMESDWVSSKNKEPTLFKFVDYAPLVFLKVRSLSGIKEEDYQKSLGPEQVLNSLWTNNLETLYELCSSGKSGSLFYFTKDRKYMIKTLPYREFSKLRSILEQYVDHLTGNPDSMIARFFGMYKIEWEDPTRKQL